MKKLLPSKLIKLVPLLVPLKTYSLTTGDQIDVAVNAPKAGTITELLAAEEDTVAVGQDLFRMEPGAAPAGGQSLPVFYHHYPNYPSAYNTPL